MFGIGKMWVYGIAALALAAAVFFGLRAVYDAGYGARDAEAQRDAQIAQAAASKAEKTLRETKAADHQARERERTDAKQEIDRLRVQLAAGTVRLRVPVAPARDSRDPGTRTAETRADPGPAIAESAAPGGPGLRVPVTATLEPATSLELLSIAAEGDAAIRDLNECVDAYALVRKTLHGLKRTD